MTCCSVLLCVLFIVFSVLTIAFSAASTPRNCCRVSLSDAAETTALRVSLMQMDSTHSRRPKNSAGYNCGTLESKKSWELAG